MTLIEQLNPLINIVLALISGGTIAAVLNYLNQRKKVAHEYDLGVRNSEASEESAAFQNLLSLYEKAIAISQNQEERVGALEAQMTTWTPDSGLESPDRMDAMVWGFTELLLAKQGAFVVASST